MKEFQTPREIISALGGPRVLAARLGLGRTAVHNWAAQDYIPVYAEAAIREALGEIEARCPDNIFHPRLVLRPKQHGDNHAPSC